jgi:hypothetical protein
MDTDVTLIGRMMHDGNIAGLWAVVGALIALLGIFVNNFFENKRSNVSRKKILIKQAYMEAADSLAHYYHIVADLAVKDISAGVREDSTAKSYKFYMSATPKSLSAFSGSYTAYTSDVYTLLLDKIDIQSKQVEMDSNNQSIDAALRRQGEINQERSVLNDRAAAGEDVSVLWQQLDEHYKEQVRIYDDAMTANATLNPEIASLKLRLSQKAAKILLRLHETNMQTLMVMRADLDLKLKRKDAKEFKELVANVSLLLEKDFCVFINSVNSRIEKESPEAAESSTQ